MSGGQKLSDSAVIKLEKTILSNWEDLQRVLHGLQGTLDGLEGQWKGIGAGAFDAKQRELNQSTKRIGNSLADFLEALNESRKIKAGTEDEIQAQVNKINVNDGVGAKSGLQGL